MNPDTPDSASCTTDTCPTKPVITTSERISTAAMTLFISACRKSNGSTMRAMAQPRPPSTAGRSRRSGTGTGGSDCSTKSPRLGSDEPRTNKAITISTNTSSGCTPGIGTPSSVGNQRCVDDVVEEALARPDRQPGETGDPERGEVGEQGRRQPRHHLQRQGPRIDGDDRPGQDRQRTDDEAGDQRVGHRQAVRRQTGPPRRRLVLERRPRLEAEATPAVDRRQRRRDDDDDGRQDEHRLRDRDVEDHHRVGWAARWASSWRSARSRGASPPGRSTGRRATRPAWPAAAPCAADGRRSAPSSIRRARRRPRSRRSRPEC